MPTRLVVLLSLTLARMSMAFQFQLVPALSAYFLDDLGLSFASLGALAGAYLLPGILAALFSGWLGTRVGDIRTALAGLALMTLGGLVAAFATTLEAQIVLRVIAGSGAVALNVMVTKMVGDWFQGRRDLPMAMGVLISSWPSGIALAMLVLPSLALSAGSTVALLAAPAFSGLALVLLAFGWRSPDTAEPDARAVTTLRLTRQELLSIGLAGLIWALYNVGLINLIAWAPEAMTAAGRSTVAAAAVVSLVGWTSILSVPAGGWLAGRIGRKEPVAIASLALSGLMALGLTRYGTGESAGSYLIALGIVFGPAAGIIMTLPVQALRPEARSFGMGLFLAYYYLLMGVAPFAMGLLLETTGDPGAPIAAAGLLFFLCIGLWALFRLIGPARPPAVPT